MFPTFPNISLGFFLAENAFSKTTSKTNLLMKLVR